MKDNKDNKAKRTWYGSNLQNFIDCVAAPSGKGIRDHLSLILAIIYMLWGTLIIFFPDNNILKKIGYEDHELNYLLAGIFVMGGVFLIAYWLFMINKICWIKQNKEVTAENCWRGLKILFIFLLLPILMKKFVAYALREARQEKVGKHILGILGSLCLTLMILFPLEIQVLKLLVRIGASIFKRVPTQEVIALLLVVTLIATFFFCCRKTVYYSIQVEEEERKRYLLKMKEKDVDTIIEKEYMELYKEADEELEYSEIYFYVIANVILLSLHFEDKDIYGKLFADQFMGVTALAALFREVKSKNDHHTL